MPADAPLSGQTIEAFLISMQHVPLFSMGLNCALGAQMRPYLEAIAEQSPAASASTPTPACPTRWASTAKRRVTAKLVGEFATTAG